MNAETRKAMGDERGARGAMRSARDNLLKRASRITDPRMRASFLSRVPDNARLLELAQAWGPEEAPAVEVRAGGAPR